MVWPCRLGNISKLAQMTRVTLACKVRIPSGEDLSAPEAADDPWITADSIACRIQHTIEMPHCSSHACQSGRGQSSCAARFLECSILWPALDRLDKDGGHLGLQSRTSAPAQQHSHCISVLHLHQGLHGAADRPLFKAAIAQLCMSNEGASILHGHKHGWGGVDIITIERGCIMMCYTAVGKVDSSHSSQMGFRFGMDKTS